MPRRPRLHSPSAATDRARAGDRPVAARARSWGRPGRRAHNHRSLARRRRRRRRNRACSGRRRRSGARTTSPTPISHPGATPTPSRACPAYPTPSRSAGPASPPRIAPRTASSASTRRSPSPAGIRESSENRRATTNCAAPSTRSSVRRSRLKKVSQMFRSATGRPPSLFSRLRAPRRRRARARRRTLKSWSEAPQRTTSTAQCGPRPSEPVRARTAQRQIRPSTTEPECLERPGVRARAGGNEHSRSVPRSFRARRRHHTWSSTGVGDVVRRPWPRPPHGARRLSCMRFDFLTAREAGGSR